MAFGRFYCLPGSHISTSGDQVILGMMKMLQNIPNINEQSISIICVDSPTLDPPAPFRPDAFNRRSSVFFCHLARRGLKHLKTDLTSRYGIGYFVSWKQVLRGMDPGTFRGSDRMMGLLLEVPGYHETFTSHYHFSKTEQNP